MWRFEFKIGLQMLVFICDNIAMKNQGWRFAI